MSEPTAPVLFIGDSVTDAGRDRSDPDDLGGGYPALVAASHAAAARPGSPDGVRFVNRGISGNRVRDLRARWRQDCLDLAPELVSIMIGVNDMWRRYDAGDPTPVEDFERDYRAILTDTVDNGAPRLVLVEPFLLPVREEQQAWRTDLDPKIAVVRQLAEDYSATLVPLDEVLTARQPPARPPNSPATAYTRPPKGTRSSRACGPTSSAPWSRPSGAERWRRCREGGALVERISERLLNWASVLEPNTRRQAELTATMPFIHPHVALMPDAHLGKGATVGSVIPTLGAIIPAAVGVDIGCGMIAVRTQFTPAGSTGGTGRPLRLAIEQAIPLSAGGAQPEADRDRRGADRCAGGRGAAATTTRCCRTGGCSWARWARATTSSRSPSTSRTGSGCSCTRGRAASATSSPSGTSRSPSSRCERRWIQLPDRDLAYLVEGTTEFAPTSGICGGRSEFALLNREEMMDRVVGCFERLDRRGGRGGSSGSTATTTSASANGTSASEVWLSRKGAIEATKGKPGLIPGSMGTASYVVAGMGNPSRCTPRRTARAATTPGPPPARRSRASSCGRR